MKTSKSYIEIRSAENRNDTLASISNDLLETYKSDPYSSTHVADFLVLAGQAHQILSLIEQDPLAEAIGDPVNRRQVQLRRFRLSLASCDKSGSSVDALKTILLGAESVRTDDKLNDTLEEEMDLAVEFSGPSLRRTILLDRDRIEIRGSFLAQDAARAARKGDRLAAWERLHSYELWLSERGRVDKHEVGRWSISDLDVAALVEAELKIAGSKNVFQSLMRWRPRESRVKVIAILVPRLIAAGEANYIKELLQQSWVPKPWDLLLWIPLAMAGERVDSQAIEKSLLKLTQEHIPQQNPFSSQTGTNDWSEHLLITFISACDLSLALRLDEKATLKAVSLILASLEEKEGVGLHSYDAKRLSGILRCWLLNRTFSGSDLLEEDFIEYAEGLDRKLKKIGKGKAGSQDNEPEKHLDPEFKDTIRALFPVYLARHQVISLARQGESITGDHLSRLSEIPDYTYRFSFSHYRPEHREIAARCVMGLLFIADIKASDLINKAKQLIRGRSQQHPLTNRMLSLWAAMSLRPSESSLLVREVSDAAERVINLQDSASSKLSLLIDLARLILPISRDDAKALFNDAVDIAKEIDQEAFDQIEFTSILAKNTSGELAESDRQTIAKRLDGFITKVAENLSVYEGFPWRSAAKSLTCVDYKTSLATISRWSDNGTEDLDETFEQYLISALRKGMITPSISSAVSLIIDGADGDLFQEIIGQAMTDPAVHQTAFEELARQILLFKPQHRRLSLGREVLACLPRELNRGEWLEQLGQTVTFIDGFGGSVPEEEASSRSDYEAKIDNKKARVAKVDLQDKPPITPETINGVLEDANKLGPPYENRDLINRMRALSSEPKDRSPFLDALVGIPSESIRGFNRIEAVIETIIEWQGTAAIRQWCKQKLPDVIVDLFHEATRWLGGGQTDLPRLLEKTGLEADDRLKIILKGVAKTGHLLTSKTLFGIACLIAYLIGSNDADALLSWYSTHLHARIGTGNQNVPIPSNIPGSLPETLGRFLYAQMSDIDVRIRWRAAHVLRQLAKYGNRDIVEATVEQSARADEALFRDPTEPYYSMAAKLWLVIALYRISNETPEILDGCKQQLFQMATSSELPHVLIREYARLTLLQLASAGNISMTYEENDQLLCVNTSAKAPTNKSAGYRSFDMLKNHKHRFNYDTMDTLPYWYTDLLRIFPTVSPQEVIDLADRWIIDKWGAPADAYIWDDEPREARKSERNSYLMTHRHGSLPTIERFATHLEWHAMHCVAGELLETHPTYSGDEDGGDSFEYWIERFLPSYPSGWISDNRGPTPLEVRLWRKEPKTDSGWLHRIRQNEFLTEIGLHPVEREGWMVVQSNHSTEYSSRTADVSVRVALVDLPPIFLDTKLG